MNTQLRLLYLDLIETAGRLEGRIEPEAVEYRCGCWERLADLAEGCRCEERARSLVDSARRYLDEGVAV